MGMSRDEFSTLVKGMKAVYTSPGFIPDKAAFDVWYGLLNDLPYSIAAAAVQSWMCTQSKSPTIADIRLKAQSLRKQEELTEMEAWTRYVLPAIKRGAYDYREAWENMPESIQRCITPEWIHDRALSADFNESVESSNFMRSYRMVTQQNTQKALVHKRVRELVEDAVKKIGVNNE